MILELQSKIISWRQDSFDFPEGKIVLALKLRYGSLAIHPPHAWSGQGSKRECIETRFRVVRSKRVEFSVESVGCCG